MSDALKAQTPGLGDRACQPRGCLSLRGRVTSRDYGTPLGSGLYKAIAPSVMRLLFAASPPITNGTQGRSFI